MALIALSPNLPAQELLATISADDGASVTNLDNVSLMKIDSTRNIAYLIAGHFQNKLIVLDISNASNPFFLSETEINRVSRIEFNEITNSLYITRNSFFGPIFEIIDVSNPANPQIQTSIDSSTEGFENFSSASNVFLNNKKNLILILGDSTNYVTIIDISDPENPMNIATLTPSTEGFNEPLMPYFIANGEGDIFYFFGRSTLNGSMCITEINISNPSIPIIEGITNLSSPAITMAAFIKDNFIYTGTATGFLVIFNAIDSDNIFIETIANTIDNNLSGIVPFVFNNVSFDNERNIAYLAGSSDFISINGISSSIDTVLFHLIQDGVNGFHNLSGIQGIYLDDQKKHLYSVSNVDNAFNIIDVNNSLNPTLLSSTYDSKDGFEGLHDISDMVIDSQKGIIYAASPKRDSISIIDISDLENPILLKTVYDKRENFEKLNDVGELALNAQKTILYSTNKNPLNNNATHSSMTIIDIAIPSHPRQLSIIDSNTPGFEDLRCPCKIISSEQDSIVFLSSEMGDFVAIIDTSDPFNPTLLSKIKNNENGFSDFINANLMAFSEEQNVLYVLSKKSSFLENDSKLTIINVEDKSNPTLITEIIHDQDTQIASDFPALDFDKNQKLIFITSHNRLTIIDVSDPSQPGVLGFLDAEDENNELIKDITTIKYDSKKRKIYALNLRSQISGMTSSDSGVTIIDLSNLAAPVIEDQFSVFAQGFNYFDVSDFIFDPTSNLTIFFEPRTSRANSDKIFAVDLFAQGPARAEDWTLFE